MRGQLWRWLQEATAVLAMACVVGYMGILVFTPLREYALWQAGSLGLTLVSLLCGVLLGLITRRAPMLALLAAALGVGVFGLIWSAVAWAQVGPVIPLAELLLADAVFLFVLQRGSLLFAISACFGLLGALAVMIFGPRPDQTPAP